MRGYRDLVVWQKSKNFCINIYKLTSKFPEAERFGLMSQLRRAAVSIPSNIAEGQARRSTNEFVRFLSIALGSLAEAETQIMIARRLDYLNEEQMNELLALSAEVGRILNGLANSITSNN